MAKEEMEIECIDHEEIIIHPRDYNVRIRKKLLNVLNKLGISVKTKTVPRKT